MTATCRTLGLMALYLLLFVTLVTASSSSSGASSSTALSSSIDRISDYDEEITEVLTKLEEQVEIALDKLGSAAAEIDVDVIFDNDGSDSDLTPQLQEAVDEEDGRYGDDEWVVIVPRTNSVPVPVLPFNDGDLEAKQENDGERGEATAFATRDSTPLDSDSVAVPQGTHRRPEWQEQQEKRDDRADWAAYFAPNGWGVDSYRQFDQRQLLGPPNLAVLTVMTCIAMLLVLGVWSLSRRSQRHRAAERQSQWAASVELLDAMPYFDNSIV